ncbi:MAG: TIM barrel protein [Gaiellaceae bacterium]
MRVGTHVPAGDPFGGASTADADVVQLHLSAPLQWRAPRQRSDADAQALRAADLVGSVHAPYLCNPASADPLVRERTTTVLQQTLDEAERVGARGVIVHAGHAAGGGTMADALARWLDTAAPLQSAVPLLVENTASGSAAPGRHLEDIVALFEALHGADLGVPIGACLDTCHAFAGDPASAQDPTGWVDAFAAAAGGIDVLHVNDSRVPAGGGRDLHARIGQGMIPTDTLTTMIRAAAAHGAHSAILETPGDLVAKRDEIALLRAVLDGEEVAP